MAYSEYWGKEALEDALRLSGSPVNTWVSKTADSMGVKKLLVTLREPASSHAQNVVYDDGLHSVAVPRGLLPNISPPKELVVEVVRNMSMYNGHKTNCDYLAKEAFALTTKEERKTATRQAILLSRETQCAERLRKQNEELRTNMKLMKLDLRRIREEKKKADDKMYTQVEEIQAHMAMMTEMYNRQTETHTQVAEMYEQQMTQDGFWRTPVNSDEETLMKELAEFHEAFMPKNRRELLRNYLILIRKDTKQRKKVCREDHRGSVSKILRCTYKHT